MDDDGQVVEVTLGKSGAGRPRAGVLSHFELRLAHVAAHVASVAATNAVTLSVTHRPDGGEKQ